MTPDLIQRPNANGGRAGCKKYDANSELMEDHGQAWCSQNFINHITVYYLLHQFHHTYYFESYNNPTRVSNVVTSVDTI